MANTLETLVIAVGIFGILLSMSALFYTDFSDQTGHNATSVKKIANIANATEIIKESDKILKNQTQPQESNLLTISSHFLSVGISVINLVVSTPQTIYNVLVNIGDILPAGISIPAGFVNIIFVITAVTVMFGIARFLAGRSES